MTSTYSARVTCFLSHHVDQTCVRITDEILSRALFVIIFYHRQFVSCHFSRYVKVEGLQG